MGKNHRGKRICRINELGERVYTIKCENCIQETGEPRIFEIKLPRNYYLATKHGIIYKHDRKAKEPVKKIRCKVCKTIDNKRILRG